MGEASMALVRRIEGLATNANDSPLVQVKMMKMK